MQDLVKKLAASSVPWAVVARGINGHEIAIGDGEPVLSIQVKNQRGERALRSLSQLEICEAYIRGDLDLEGDLIRAAAFQRLLSDRQILIKLWRRVKPLLLGRARCNPQWISQHYDQNNIQLLAADRDYHTYTPGVYLADGDTLEAGAARKLESAFRALRLGPGSTVLDVGCGWGGFIRYCAARQVEATGITLSRNQLAFAQSVLDRENLHATLTYQDFFTYNPDEQYDAVALMGVLEDLSDYEAVITRLRRWVKPGGKVYLDFAAARQRFGTSSFITKYIWPGTFRMVYLPELITAIWKSPFDIVELHNDARNYRMWAEESYRRWLEQKATVIARAGEQLWRTFRIMHAGTVNVMSDPSYGVTAYRMVLEYPQGR
jgi:cyclopropane-fatty-acyl-phospholipid synthase